MGGPTFSNIRKKEKGDYKFFTTKKNAYLFYKEVTLDNGIEKVNHETKLLTEEQCAAKDLPLWYSMTLVFCNPKLVKGKVTCTGKVTDAIILPPCFNFEKVKGRQYKIFPNLDAYTRMELMKATHTSFPNPLNPLNPVHRATASLRYLYTPKEQRVGLLNGK